MDQTCIIEVLMSTDSHLKHTPFAGFSELQKTVLHQVNHKGDKYYFDIECKELFKKSHIKVLENSDFSIVKSYRLCPSDTFNKLFTERKEKIVYYKTSKCNSFNIIKFISISNRTITKGFFVAFQKKSMSLELFLSRYLDKKVLKNTFKNLHV